jgi:hypothetical protein
MRSRPRFLRVHLHVDPAQSRWYVVTVSPSRVACAVLGVSASIQWAQTWPWRGWKRSGCLGPTREDNDAGHR